MSWKLKEEAKSWEPIAGCPWRDMTDEEFDAVCAEYDKGFPDQPRSLERWFMHEGEKKTKKGESG